MRKKRVPLRMCTGCGEMKPKSELVRVVKSPGLKDENGNLVLENVIMLDLNGKKPGRGAYVCKNSSCLKAAKKTRRLERAFSCKIPDEVYNRMEEELAKNG